MDARDEAWDWLAQKVLRAFANRILVVVGLVVSLPLAPARPRPIPNKAPSIVGAAGMAVAAGAHLAAFPAHGGEGVAIATFFAAIAGWQATAAYALLRRPGRTSQLVIVAGNLGLLGLWSWSRTAGVPFGPHAGVAEAVGGLDAIAAAAQVVTVAAVLAGRLGDRERAPLRGPPLGCWRHRRGLRRRCCPRARAEPSAPRRGGARRSETDATGGAGDCERRHGGQRRLPAFASVVVASASRGPHPIQDPGDTEHHP